jgi:hypothetical protein
MNTTNKGLITNPPVNNIVLYTDKRGNVELRADVEKETIWAKQAHISRLFGVDTRTVNEHLMNIFKTRELNEISVIRKFRITAKDGKQYLTKFYNLDAIIAVGYRVNSKKATKFRIWATRILREYLVKGFNLDKRQLALSADKLEDVKEAIAFMESESRGGPLKAKMTVRLSRNLLP